MTQYLVIGKSGQLAYELQTQLGDKVILLGEGDIDIFDLASMSATLEQYNPAAIINAAAYTAVDKAEENQATAYALNAQAVQNLATYCKAKSLFLVHVSTDYVFDGQKGAPYTVDDKIAPQGVYGATKAAGEAALLELLPAHSCILRTSWVYSSHGNNFVKTMLRLMAEKPELRVIDDQVGSPTWAKGLASACVEAAIEKHAGVYHWSDEGVTSWYDFAFAIQSLGLQKGLLTNAIPIYPIPTSDYPTPAKRPLYSVLDKTLTRKTFSSPLKNWQTQLSMMMDQL